MACGKRNRDNDVCGETYTCNSCRANNELDSLRARLVGVEAKLREYEEARGNKPVSVCYHGGIPVKICEICIKDFEAKIAETETRLVRRENELKGYWRVDSEKLSVLESSHNALMRIAEMMAKVLARWEGNFSSFHDNDRDLIDATTKALKVFSRWQTNQAKQDKRDPM